jgi:hypothetical protein
MSWEAEWEEPESKKPVAIKAITKAETAPSDSSASPDSTAAELDELAATANKWHDEATSHAVEAAWHAGTALNNAFELKEHGGHGNWCPWLKENFHGSRKTATDYRNIAKAGDSVAKVTSLVTFADGTPVPNPSINAVLKAIAKRNKKDPKPPKSSTLFNRWLKKVDAVIGDGPAMSDNAGHLTSTEADKVADQMEGWIEILRDVQDFVSGIAADESR